jgi:phosphoglycolate phosphatase-like HAD superfamily hydrolase
MLGNYKVLLWDFDGVIMDSMPIRTMGFEKVLKGYPQTQIDQLLAFHKANGGLSRYVKFKYFFENIRKEKVSNTYIAELANQFSEIMLSLLINKELLINDSVSFIRENYHKYDMHIVSGSDGNELRRICNELELSRYFKTINGSPVPKSQLVKINIETYNYNKNEIVLIGDSKNDYDASHENDISFLGYNNIGLKGLGQGYIDHFSSSIV